MSRDFFSDPTTPLEAGVYSDPRDRTVSSHGLLGSAWRDVTPSVAGARGYPRGLHGRGAPHHAHGDPHHGGHPHHVVHSQPHFRSYSTLRSRDHAAATPSLVSTGSMYTITPPDLDAINNPRPLDALRTRRSVSPVAPTHALTTTDPADAADAPLLLEAPPAPPSGAFQRKLLMLALLVAVALAALLWVDRGPTWAPCWAREALWGVFYDYPSVQAEQGLSALGVSRCDVYDDIAFTEGELIRVLAHAYAKHGQDGLPGDVLAKETKRVLYHTEEGAARRYVPHLPLRMHFIVLDEAIARSDYLTAARAQTFVGMFPAPSLVSFAARHFDGETRALLFWRLCWSGLCWAVVAAGAAYVVIKRWMAHRAAQKKLKDDTNLLLTTAYDVLRRHRGRACTMAELRRFCMAALKGRMTMARIVALWPAPGEGPEGPIEVELRADVDCDVRAKSDSDPTVMISLRGFD